MTSNQCKRLQQIQHLSAFGTECHKSVQSLLSELNWDEKQVLNCEPLVLCPYDSRHRMSCQSIGKHLEKCELKANGLTNEEIETLPPSSAFYYSESADISPVVIDKQIEDTILGEPIGDGFRGNRSRIELSSEQRLALYSHVIQTNRKTRDESTIDDKQSEQSLKSLTIDLFSDVREKLDTNPDKQKQEVVDRLEMIAMNRDMKRRQLIYFEYYYKKQFPKKIHRYFRSLESSLNDNESGFE
ncbi:unnamed protein product [Oppiella nova]|uniref:CHHC U11-48K-type domain-containing protein n=1 Tax=Oppiella nova TaxID=334625 RepID=A0A7R9QFF3_9ACAR|nr:unnamed protein product [Oppiella nova]CAG2164759.1 unnamed protein product [Oppiella nova]